jgi:hypothetical protein
MARRQTLIGKWKAGLSIAKLRQETAEGWMNSFGEKTMNKYFIDVGISLEHHSVEDAFSITTELFQNLEENFQTEKNRPHCCEYPIGCGYHDVRFEFETNEVALKAYDFIKIFLNQKGVMLGDYGKSSYVTEPYLKVSEPG